MSRSDSAARCASVPQAAADAAAWIRAGLRVRLVRGTFDLLQAAHLKALIGARSGADRLIVGVWSDALVAGRGAPGRPVVTAADRVRLVAALRGVERAVELSQEAEALGLSADDIVDLAESLEVEDAVTTIRRRLGSTP